MVMEGCPVEAVDDAMVAWGFPIGPLALVDEVGIDVASKIAGIMADAFGDRATPPEAFAALVADGRFGKKAGRGFYRYDGGKRTDADPDVYPLLDAAPRVEADPGKIQRRVSTPMIMEAIRCLEEGVLRSAGDGDVAAVMGLGFPPFRGGPFHLVDTLGARDFLERTRELARQHGARFDPPALLEQHASTGEPFRT